MSRPNSIFGQRSMTTVTPFARARSAAASLTTPSCIQITRGRGSSRKRLVDHAARGGGIAEDVDHVDRAPGHRRAGRRPSGRE